MDLNIFGFQVIVIIFLVETQIVVPLASKSLFKLTSESFDMSLIVILGSPCTFFVPNLEQTILQVALVSLSKQNGTSRPQCEC